MASAIGLARTRRRAIQCWESARSTALAGTSRSAWPGTATSTWAPRTSRAMSTLTSSAWASGWESAGSAERVVGVRFEPYGQRGSAVGGRTDVERPAETLADRLHDE